MVSLLGRNPVHRKFVVQLDTHGVNRTADRVQTQLCFHECY